MATNTLLSPANLTVDLSGLPEPVARGIRQLVQTLKEEHSGMETTTPAAGHEGQPPAEYLTSLFISRPTPGPAEMERLLDELASKTTGKVLPPDFSRADIYDDHD